MINTIGPLRHSLAAIFLTKGHHKESTKTSPDDFRAIFYPSRLRHSIADSYGNPRVDGNSSCENTMAILTLKPLSYPTKIKRIFYASRIRIFIPPGTERADPCPGHVASVIISPNDHQSIFYSSRIQHPTANTYSDPRAGEIPLIKL
jgi:hypothetical protein